MSPIEIPKSTGWFESFDKTKIYFESRGSGEPIVFVYGIGCLMNHWHHQISFFSQHYRTILLDLRGHHRSEGPAAEGSMTIGACSQDIEFLLNHLGIEKAHLVGHSFGVPVLLEFASRFRRSISLTLINGFASNPLNKMFGLDLAEPLFFQIDRLFRSNPDFASRLWKTLVGGPLAGIGAGLLGGFNLHLTQFKDIEIYTRGISQMNLKYFLPLFKDMMAYDGTGACIDILVPTLILAGEKDMVTPASFQVTLHDSIRGSQLVTIPYGSHCTQLDFPDYVNLRIERHLRALT